MGYYPDHPNRRGRNPTGPVAPEDMDIDKYWYLNSGNKNIFYSLEHSARYLERLAKKAVRDGKGKTR